MMDLRDLKDLAIHNVQSRGRTCHGPPSLCLSLPNYPQIDTHPGGNPGENPKSISHRCHPILVAFVLELTEETIYLPRGCLQGGSACHKLLSH